MRVLSLGVAALIVSLVAGCGATASHPAGQPNAAGASAAAQPAGTSVTGTPLIPFTFSTSFEFNGFQAPYYAALANGYYRDQGLDVHIVEGVSPADSIQWLTSGKVDLTVDIWETVIAVDNKGGRVKVVAGMQQASPFGLIYSRNHPITAPADLYRAVVGVPPGTAAAVSLQEFIAAEHLDPSRIKVVNTASTAQLGLLGQGKLTAFAGGGYLFVPLAAQAGIKVGYLPFSKYNVGATGDNLVTTDQMLARHPDWVRKFLAATAEGFVYAQAHPRQAARDEVRYLPKLKYAAVLGELKLSVPLTPTPYDQGRPWGWMAPQDWQRILKMTQEFQGVKNPLPIDDYYTNTYLPSAAG